MAQTWTKAAAAAAKKNNNTIPNTRQPPPPPPSPPSHAPCRLVGAMRAPETKPPFGGGGAAASCSGGPGAKRDEADPAAGRPVGGAAAWLGAALNGALALGVKYCGNELAVAGGGAVVGADAAGGGACAGADAGTGAGASMGTGAGAVAGGAEDMGVSIVPAKKLAADPAALGVK
jgi:hypothetical protein